jgi:hypothetical protein
VDVSGAALEELYDRGRPKRLEREFSGILVIEKFFGEGDGRVIYSRAVCWREGL